MAKRFPVAPAHPKRNCWGCDLFCAATDLRCGNGSVRMPHPVDLFAVHRRDRWPGALGVGLGLRVTEVISRPVCWAPRGPGS